MEPDDFPEPDDLWWSWVVLAALHRAVGNESCRYDARHRVLHLDAEDGSWVRMQRALRSRAILWGRSDRAPQAPADARASAPDWAVTDAMSDRRPSFLSWHAHGEWDSSRPDEDEGAVHLLRPVLSVDPRAVELARAGRLDAGALGRWSDGVALAEAAELVRQAGRGIPVKTAGAVRSRLRDQIHDQMRDAEERDRMLIQRPPSLVQWSRVNGLGLPFEYAVLVTRQRTFLSPTSTVLPEPLTRTLLNVLLDLHRSEAGEESGAWLFARVASDGVVITFDRAFDSWPGWFQVSHVSQGPGLDDLAWEMGQRSPQWRPAWASLLPQR